MRRRVLLATAAAVACLVQVSAASADIVIPAGGRATLSGAQFSACNSLAYGYALGSGPNQEVDAKTAICVTGASANGAIIGPFSAAQSLRIYLSDVTCGTTYYSDGSGAANHAFVTASNPFTVEMSDGGATCQFTTVARPPNVPSPPLDPTPDDFQVSVAITSPPAVSVTAPPPPGGQNGYFNSQDLASLSGSVPVSVSASGGTGGVTSLSCTDNGAAVAVAGESGSGPRTGTVEVSSNGAHAISCTASDAAGDSGNSGGSNSASVSVDTNGPSLTVPAAPLIIGAAGAGGARIASYPVSASDADPGDTPSIGCTPQAPAQFPIGDTTVSCKAIDRAGNSVTKQFIVRVARAPSANGTTVVCSPETLAVGETTTCNATVTDAGGAGSGTPTGMVTFVSSGAGAFAGSNPCTLTGGGLSASCSLSYTPSAVGSGEHTITAAYGGDSTHAAGSGSMAVTVSASGVPSSSVPGPPPKAGVTASAGVVGGTVLVKVGSGSFVPLTGDTVPIGATIDARKGVVKLTTSADYLAARNRHHRVQTGTFSEAIFTIKQLTERQARARHLKGTPATDLVLTNQPGAASKAHCRRRGPPGKGIVRSLNGVAKGLYRTIGAASTTTVTNAAWTVQDRCDGTLTKVTKGRATVTATTHHGRRRTVTLSAGQELLVKERLLAIKRLL